MKALVTGGGGFLGSRIAELLHEQGVEVTAAGRSSYPQLARRGIRTLRADVRDSAAMHQACAGMDAVYHAAAMTNLWGARRALWDVNVLGTQNVIAACRRQRVQKLVYTSTPSVVFGEQELCGADESVPYASSYLAAYPETKALAERMVLEANSAGLLTVALRPHLVWGPGDPHLLPRVIARATAGRLVRVGDGCNLVDITYIDNAASAHVLACDALRPGSACTGRAYFVSQGEPVRLWDWLGDILARLGLPPVTKVVSYRTARRLGAVLEWVHAGLRLRSEPRMTRFLAAQLAKSHYFDISAARRDLGYHPAVSTAEGLQRFLASLGC